MPPKLNAAFYTEPGSEPPSQPVREWLKSLPREDRMEIGSDIQAVQFGWPLGLPLVRHLPEQPYSARHFCFGRQHHVPVAWIFQDHATNTASAT